MRAGKAAPLPPGNRGCGGFTLIEILFALVLSLIVASAAWSMIILQSRASVEMSASADRLDAVRMIRGVLGAEIREGRRERDWRILGSDSLSLRAFRGLALPCGPPVEDVAIVSYRGTRRPDPRKDSVLVLRIDGSWRALDLTAVGPVADSSLAGTPTETLAGADTCSAETGDSRLEEWVVEGVGSRFVVARIFERGSYHLSDASFRYRIGAGGRQPLIPELLEDAGSEWRMSPSGSALLLRLSFREGSNRFPTPGRMATLWFHDP